MYPIVCSQCQQPLSPLANIKEMMQCELHGTAQRPSDILVEVPTSEGVEYVSYQNIVDCNQNAELEIVTLNDGTFVGKLGDDISSMNYDLPIDVRIYHWAKVNGHCY